jgi:AcrR family transcriptional regulator
MTVTRVRRRSARPTSDDSDLSLEAWRRNQLLEATTACIADAGIERTTMRMVADRAGVTTGMLLYYFKNKKELVQAATDSITAKTKSRLDELSHATFGTQRLENVLRASLIDPEEGLSRKIIIQLRKEALTNEEARLSYLPHMLDARERLSRSVRVGQQQGQLTTSVPVEMTADLIYCLMEGLATETVLSPEYFPPEHATQLGLRLLDLLSTSTASRSETAPAPSPAESAGDADAGDSLRRVPDLVEALLLSDSHLSRQIADDLAQSFRTMYGISVRARDDAKPPGQEPARRKQRSLPSARTNAP